MVKQHSKNGKNPSKNSGINWEYLYYYDSRKGNFCNSVSYRDEWVSKLVNEWVSEHRHHFLAEIVLTVIPESRSNKSLEVLRFKAALYIFMFLTTIHPH